MGAFDFPEPKRSTEAVSLCFNLHISFGFSISNVVKERINQCFIQQRTKINPYSPLFHSFSLVNSISVPEGNLKVDYFKIGFS